MYIFNNFFLYKHNFDKQNVKACNLNEECLSIAGLQEPTCLCKTGFYRSNEKCIKIDTPNPFIKQELGCEHSYAYSENDELVCTCFDGYSLGSGKFI